MDKAGFVAQQNDMRPGPNNNAVGYAPATIITVAGHLAPLLAARALWHAQQEGGSSVIKVSLPCGRSAHVDRLPRGRAPVVAALPRQERTGHRHGGRIRLGPVLGPRPFSWGGPLTTL